MTHLLIPGLALTVLVSILGSVGRAQEVPPAPTAPMMPDPTAGPAPSAPPPSPSPDQKPEKATTNKDGDTRPDRTAGQPKK